VLQKEVKHLQLVLKVAFILSLEVTYGPDERQTRNLALFS